jgi:nucleoid-associated protein YgaU
MAFQKIKITVLHTGASFNVDFNPEEYTLNKDNNFASQAIPGLSGPIVQFVNGNQRTLDMELFFDTYDTDNSTKQDVRTLTGQVMQLMDIDSNLHAPPVLLVAWSSLQFTCVLARASQKFIMFTEDGTPVRARLTVSFHEYLDPELEAEQVNRQTSDYTKIYTVTRGQTLSEIAGELYEDPTQWRSIAIANDIDDPRSLAPGQQLLVPSLPYTNPETGQLVT